MDREYTTAASLSGLMQGGMQRAAVPTPVNPSCFGTIEHTAAEAYRIATRVRAMVDRLAGCVPEDAGTGAPKGGPNGLLAEATDHALSIQGSLAAISGAMDRLEKHLP